jgi:predicted HicB family RNase H-like nuclease
MLGNAMRYKDYVAQITYDPSIDSFHGRVIGMRDVVDFIGRTPEELRKEFAKSVEDYIAWCASEGAVPQKTWSGKLTIRPSEELRNRLVLASAASGQSINTWVTEVLDREARKVLDDAAD